MSGIYETYSLVWSGISITVRYNAEWIDTHGEAHLEIVSEGHSPMPISRTGYKSYCCARLLVEEYGGGPVAFVTDWLDRASNHPDWKKLESAGRQLSLF